MEILEILAAYKTGQYVFPGSRGDRPLSHIAMQKVLTRLDVDDATIHGFRSAVRDWAGNETHFAWEVAEAALAHILPATAPSKHTGAGEVNETDSVFMVASMLAGAASAQAHTLTYFGNIVGTEMPSGPRSQFYYGADGGLAGSSMYAGNTLYDYDADGNLAGSPMNSGLRRDD